MGFARFDPSTLEELVDAYPEKPWDWDVLTDHPLITKRFREARPRLPWREDDVFVFDFPSSREIDLDEVFASPNDVKWNWTELSSHPALSIKFVNQFKAKLNMYRVSKTASLDVLTNADLNWDWYGVSENHNVTYEFMQSRPDAECCLVALSRNPHVDLNIVFAYPNGPWDWKSVSKSPHLSLEFVKRMPSQTPWLKKAISKSATFEELTSDENFEWDYQAVSENVNITKSFVLNRLAKNWSYSALSANPATTLALVDALPEADWDWSALSRSPQITFEHLLERPNDVDWKTASLNPNLTLDVARRLPEGCVDWEVASRNLYDAYFDEFDSSSSVYRSFPAVSAKRQSRLANRVEKLVESVPETVARAIAEDEIPW